jgi:hypothetical protein
MHVYNTCGITEKRVVRMNVPYPKGPNQENMYRAEEVGRNVWIWL